ncbi:MAG: T9SS type A sorting domain-containing protein [Bacteroidia bacterium]|nr:T9SS type A sorting domain-containing protein [Bacteroidia bacterium]
MRSRSPLSADFIRPQIEDFDQDSDLDILLRADEHNPVLLNQGDGTILAGTDYSFSTEPGQQVAIGDFNHDGLDDVVVVSGTSANTLSIYLNQGAKVFQPGPQYPFEGAIGKIFVGEINQDNHTDLAFNVQSDNGTKLVLLLGQGSGQFSEAASSVPGQILSLADLNQDALADLVTQDMNQLAIYQNEGQGQFRLTQSVVDTVEMVNIGDFNGDQAPDLFTTKNINELARANGQVPVHTIRLGLGNMQFSAEQGVPVGYSIVSPVVPISVVVEDFNQDNFSDFVVGGDLGTVDVYLNNQQGGFASPRFLRFVNNYNETYIRQILAGDVNGDGLKDLLNYGSGFGSEFDGNRSIDVLSINLNQGDGTFSNPTFFTSYLPQALSDFNGDDLVDIVSLPKADELFNRKNPEPLTFNIAHNTTQVPPPAGSQVVGFQLYDEDDQPFKTLSEGIVLDLDKLPEGPLSLVAITNPSEVGSVRLALSGPINQTRLENLAPYALFGDQGGDLVSKDFPVGDYTLTATPFSEASGQGTPGQPLTLHFKVVDNRLNIGNFLLINATTDKIIRWLSEGAVLDLKALGDRPLNLVALTNREVGSVHLELNGPLSRTRLENLAPYALFGDNNGDYSGQNLPVGDYTLTATPFEQMNGQGKSGPTLSIRFTITDTRVRVVELLLINAQTDQVIQALSDQAQLDLSALSNIPLAIEALTYPEVVGSVQFQLSGPIQTTRTENLARYALFGNTANDFSGRLFPTGQYTLLITPYGQAGAQGEVGLTRTLSFKVVQGPSTPAGSSASLQMYPNPADDWMQLATQLPEGSQAQLRIYNDQGQVVLSKWISGPSLENLDLSHLKKGLYLVELSLPGQTIQKRLMKE